MPIETINNKISVNDDVINDDVIIEDEESNTILESAKERLIQFNELQKTNKDGCIIK